MKVRWYSANKGLIIATIYTHSTAVDDGTGVLPCCKWRKKEDSDEGLFIPRLGQLVSIFGRLSEYRNEKQLTITHLFPEDDPNIEPLHWMEVALLKKTVYSKPFVVPPSLFRSEESQEKSLKTVVQSTIMTYLTANSSRNRFTLSQLCGDGQLLRSCVEQVKTECGKDDESLVREELHAVISNLAREGDIIPEVQPQSRETVYKVLLHNITQYTSNCMFIVRLSFYLVRYFLRKNILCRPY